MPDLDYNLIELNIGSHCHLSFLSQAAKIPKSFPCEEYVIKAQVLAGGRGKGHFDNGFKVG